MHASRKTLAQGHRFSALVFEAKLAKEASALEVRNKSFGQSWDNNILDSTHDVIMPLWLVGLDSSQKND